MGVVDADDLQFLRDRQSVEPAGELDCSEMDAIGWDGIRKEVVPRADRIWTVWQEEIVVTHASLLHYAICC
eukprot:2875549-Rhodomonas_salina.1